MKKEYKKYAEIFGGLMILLALVISWLLYTKTLRDNFQKEIILSLEEVSVQGQNNMKFEINGKLELLNEVSRRIGLYEPAEYSTAVFTLLDTCEENGFKRMGIIAADGNTYTTDGVELSLHDRDYYKNGMEGKPGISEPLLDREGNGGINVYSVPILWPLAPPVIITRPVLNRCARISGRGRAGVSSMRTRAAVTCITARWV